MLSSLYNGDTRVMRQFYTPPVSNPKFDSSMAIKESYRPRGGSGLETLGEEHAGAVQEETGQASKHSRTTSASSASSLSDGESAQLGPEEIEALGSAVTELPPELQRLIDVFIADLKQPKYVRPLTIQQLSYLFQGFYTKFDKASFQYLSNGAATGTGPAPAPSYFNARETLSTGLSGIFARSRSSSTASNTASTLTRGPRRSSSLFSMESSSNSTGNLTQMLSPEEIKAHIRQNEVNNVKIERYMILCEARIFNKLLEVGISAAPASPLKQGDVHSPQKQGDSPPHPSSSSSVDTLSPDTAEKSQSLGHSHPEVFNVASLFRNTPEFGNYDRLLTEKLRCLSKLSLDGKINLDEFLGIPCPEAIASDRAAEDIHRALNKFTHYSVSPYDKVQILLHIHELMTYTKEMSNDEFLSLLIYYIIKFRPRKLFLNAEFVKLFRYKKKLVQKELYALTNMEAALMFIEGLTLSDFSHELLDELSGHDRKVLDTKVSSVITLPSATSNGSHGKGAFPQAIHDSPSRPPHGVDGTNTRSNSNDGFRNTFDGSLRNIIGKIRLYTPPTVNNLKPLPLPRSTSQLSMDYDGGSPIRQLASPTTTSSNEDDDTRMAGPVLTPSRSSNSSIPESWKKFKDTKFDELKVEELREMFELYQKLIE